MYTTPSLLWQVTLAIATAVLVAGCVPPPPPRPAGDSNTTAAEPAPAETAPSEAPPASTETAPETPAEPPAMEPRREPKPSDEPAGAATATEATTKPESETPTKPESETPAKAEPAETEKAEKPATETAPQEEMKPEDKPAEKAETPADTKPATETQPAPAAPAVESKPAATAPAAVGGDRVVSGDWPMWGGTVHRNMVNPTTKIGLDFEPNEDPAQGKKVLWVAQLGSQTYGNPVVAKGKVFVGTNNGGKHRPKHKGDRGCVLCFDEKTGKFLWQLTREKLPQGRVNDWPEQGICSTVAVDGDRGYVVTNRCELLCFDVEGFLDGENDGPIQDEPDNEPQDADIVWNLDMIETLGVFPHNMAASSPVVYGDHVYVLTSNGVDESHLEIPAPRAPSFLAVNKKTGEVAWESNDPFDKILHGQWSSPSIGLVNGQVQVYFAGGNGWLYALDAEKGEELWRFDLNPKDAKYELGGRGTKNYVIATPVFCRQQRRAGHRPGPGTRRRRRPPVADRRDQAGRRQFGHAGEPAESQLGHDLAPGRRRCGRLGDRRKGQGDLPPHAVHGGRARRSGVRRRPERPHSLCGFRHRQAVLGGRRAGRHLGLDAGGRRQSVHRRRRRHPDGAGRRQRDEEAEGDRIPVLDLQHAHHRQRRDVRLRPLAAVRDRDAIDAGLPRVAEKKPGFSEKPGFFARGSRYWRSTAPFALMWMSLPHQLPPHTRCSCEAAVHDRAKYA